MKAADIRRSFLNFFEERQHQPVASSSLVPDNDPTLFFVNAGMVPFKNVFTGSEKRDYSRATSVQKCMRVSGKHNDLENVGFTARHHTLFEMLGNFSFGDYFKREAIDFAWTFLTEVMELPTERLLITVYEDDDESFEVWRERGVPAERIGRCGAKDNFWSMGPTGPCGPCSEIHWDLQSDFVLDNEPDPWGYGVDAGRFMEIWNLVFMQYERFEEDGQIKQRDLPRPSVDTGMGLERLAAITQGHKSNWEIDEIQEVIHRTEMLADVTYGDSEEQDVCLRVIADHARAAAFLVGDGVMPRNDGRGYVLRRIMRRAIRYGVKLGIDEPFLHQCADRVIDLMHETYPELAERRDFIEKVIHSEERTFRQTLNRGLALLDDAFRDLEAEGGSKLPGPTVFLLHDTYGFPPDLCEVIASERGMHIDREGYEVAMGEARERSRLAWKGTGAVAVVDSYRRLEEDGATVFLGYDTLHSHAEVIGLLQDHMPTESVAAGEEADVVLDRTPFYAESGGQVGDTGALTGPGLKATVLDTTKPAGGVFVHRVRVDEGTLTLGAELVAEVDAERRAAIQRNHTATHLLHAALREVLGTHVQQKGSLVAPDRLRFDFSHFEPITAEQLQAVEDSVNAQVLADLRASVHKTSKDEAMSMGAMALFGEKYGDRVRVIQVPGYSTELCGGTHCRSTGEIGLVKIQSEGGVAAGVRRIEAISGQLTMDHLRSLERHRDDLVQLLRANSADDALDKVGKLIEERKELQAAVDKLKQDLVTGGGGAGLDIREVAGVQVLALSMDGVGGKDLRKHGDAFMKQLGSGVLVLGAADGGKASLLVKISRDLTDRLQAGDLVRELAPMVGGRGGGKPDLAQAGGKEPEHLPATIERAYSLVAERLRA